MSGSGAESTRIRPAEDGDLAAIQAIERASFGDPWSVESFRSMLGQPHVLATVAVRDEQVLGYCFAWHLADEAEVANLAVAPSARRSGVGAALLDELLGALSARGGVAVYLEVRAGNGGALALYSTRGFAAVGRRRAYYRRPVEDALVMRREA